jgi:hypothetical protein
MALSKGGAQNCSKMSQNLLAEDLSDDYFHTCGEWSLKCRLCYTNIRTIIKSSTFLNNKTREVKVNSSKTFWYYFWLF